MEKPSRSVRCLTRESGTFLLSSFRISESGLLIPEVGTTSFSDVNSFAADEKLEEKEYRGLGFDAKRRRSSFEVKEILVAISFPASLMISIFPLIALGFK